MTRRWWAGPGISVVLHAALLIVLIHFAALSSHIDATAASASRRTKFIFVVTPAAGTAGTGGGAPAAAAPRPARIPESRPVDISAPRTFDNVEPVPVAPVRTIETPDVDVTLGAPMSVIGTEIGPGSGPGGGGGHGPGLGPGDGPGVGEIYEAGVGGVTDPTLIHQVRPNFTVDAMRARIAGVVVLQVVVRADGSVDPAAIRITRSLDPGLDQEALIAVRQWRFRPSMRQGQPVASRVVVELAFNVR